MSASDQQRLCIQSSISLRFDTAPSSSLVSLYPYGQTAANLHVLTPIIVQSRDRKSIIYLPHRTRRVEKCIIFADRVPDSGDLT
jgi:hypothetical protein